MASTTDVDPHILANEVWVNPAGASAHTGSNSLQHQHEEFFHVPPPVPQFVEHIIYASPPDASAAHVRIHAAAHASTSPSSAPAVVEEPAPSNDEEFAASAPTVAPTSAITLAVKDQQGDQVNFRIERFAPLWKLMDAYCARLGLKQPEVRFTAQGEHVTPDDTTDVLGLEDYGLIEATRVPDTATAASALPINPEPPPLASHASVPEGAQRSGGDSITITAQLERKDL